MHLTEIEGIILGIIDSREQCTTYTIWRRFEASPTWRSSISKGAIYPAVKRLVERGLLDSERSTQGKRASDLLRLTNAGRRTLAAWVATIEPAMGSVPADPVRTRITYLQVLPHEQQLRFLDEAERVTQETLSYAMSIAPDPEVQEPWSIAAGQLGLRAQLKAKLEWLREVRELALQRGEQQASERLNAPAVQSSSEAN